MSQEKKSGILETRMDKLSLGAEPDGHNLELSQEGTTALQRPSADETSAKEASAHSQVDNDGVMEIKLDTIKNGHSDGTDDEEDRMIGILSKEGEEQRGECKVKLFMSHVIVGLYLEYLGSDSSVIKT